MNATLERSLPSDIGEVDIPTILRNDDDVYEGNLKCYFKVIFNNAKNLFNAYHNLRHMLHVMWVCYDACRFYPDDELSRHQKRLILIAALFHDFDHSGKCGNDDLEIERAIRGLRKHIAPEDAEDVETIASYIRATEFPHKMPNDELELPQQILRDADVSQALSVAWMQHIICGLSVEMGSTPTNILKMQEGFLSSLHFGTVWATMRFNSEVIQRKIGEAKGLLAILEEN